MDAEVIDKSCVTTLINYWYNSNEFTTDPNSIWFLLKISRLTIIRYKYKFFCKKSKTFLISIFMTIINYFRELFNNSQLNYSI